MARGRKSAASVAVIAAASDGRPAPPSELSAVEKTIWKEVAATKPADWFQADTQPLLVSYCRCIARLRVIDKTLGRFKPCQLEQEAHLTRYERLSKLSTRDTAKMISLARSMRLTQQSRYKSETAATGSDNAGGASKPWES